MGHGFDNTIVNLNHPYSDYGFLRNQESVAGGTESGWDGFDLLEIQSTLDLTGMDGKYRCTCGKEIELAAEQSFTLQPWQFKILEK